MKASRESNKGLAVNKKKSKLHLSLTDTRPARTDHLNIIENPPEDECFDGTNALVISQDGGTCTKRRDKSREPAAPRKKLSKRKRRQLQMVLDRKEKRARRAGVLDRLAHLPAQDLQLVSVTSLGVRRRGRAPKPADCHVQTQSVESSSEEEGLEEETAADEGDDSGANGDESDDQATPGSPERPSIEPERQSSRAETEDVDGPLPFPTGPDLPDAMSHVRVERSEEVAAQRLQLPILNEEHTVMDAVNTNPVAIICGNTGSGKTTQVPQFLLEAGYANSGMIGVTEPRRVAAVSMSARVAHELGLTGREVSYQIRYEGNVTPDTKIKFMTDGVLLKELQEDFLLSAYSVIVMDEAHERSVFTDVLLGLLSRVLVLRRRRRGGRVLKLVIMSATLRVEDFTSNHNLFNTPPPVVEISSRQFPVSAHFKKRTPRDHEYLKEAYKKVCSIHRKLPPGGAILVFLPGKEEIATMLRWLNATFPSTRQEAEERTARAGGNTRRGPRQTPPAPAAAAAGAAGKQGISTKRGRPPPPPPEEARGGGGESGKKKLRLSQFSKEAAHSITGATPLDEEPQLAGSDQLPEPDPDEEELDEKSLDRNSPLYCLPLHSMLPSQQQHLVFKPPPEGCRLCVVATNVAETSLTIPGVRYVVDPGKEKRRVYDANTGVSTLIVDWVSQASADQRAGRAGRTGPGHCYRLYSSAVFSEFAKYSPPEIQQRPIEDLVLTLKSMGINNVSNFPFPNPPSHPAIVAAEQHLCVLGATEKVVSKKKGECGYRVTSLGHSMAHFPVAPRFAKMLSLSYQDRDGLMPFAVTLVAALTVREIFVTDTPRDRRAQLRLRELHDTWRAGCGPQSGLGDMNVLLNAVSAYDNSNGSPRWCTDHGLRHKAMVEITKLRRQLTRTFGPPPPPPPLGQSEHGANGWMEEDGEEPGDSRGPPPLEALQRLDSREKEAELRQVLLSGLGDRVARRRASPEEVSERRAGGLAKGGGAYQAASVEGAVYVHPGSALSQSEHEWVAFLELEETGTRVYMRDCLAIDPLWLPVLCPALCRMSEPLEPDPPPPPTYDSEADRVMCWMTATYSRHAWPITPAQQYPHPVNLACYRHFAMHLLSGHVLPYFAPYAPLLAAKPQVMTKSWARLQPPRTESLLQALVGRECCSRHALLAAWAADPHFLLPQFLQWLPESLHQQVRRSWPPQPPAAADSCDGGQNS